MYCRGKAIYRQRGRIYRGNGGNCGYDFILFMCILYVFHMQNWALVILLCDLCEVCVFLYCGTVSNREHTSSHDVG